MLPKELDGDDFRNYLRIDYDCFNELLNLVSLLISKQNSYEISSQCCHLCYCIVYRKYHINKWILYAALKIPK